MPDIKLSTRVTRFVIAGLSALAVNILLMIFFVEVLYFRTFLLKNTANILAIVLSIGYHFWLSRVWTWKDTPPQKGKQLITQFLSFNFVNLVGISIRIVTFAILEIAGIPYVINIIFSSGLVASISFMLYDKFIFGKMFQRK
ncbi:MAG: GtrA family protein [Planctomycetes bacterium]|nr:GtrA family protein [Planctomycetota bacterium]